MANNENTIHSDYERLLEKQLEDLRVIQEKFLQMEPDNPSQEMLEALYLEVGRALNEISALKIKQDEMVQYLEEKKQTLDEIEAMQEDIERYREEKQHLVILLKFRDFENCRLRKDITRFTEWIGKIDERFKLLLNSRSWKLGSALVGMTNRLRFKKKTQTSADKILNVFADYKKWQRSDLEADQQENELDTVNEDYKMLSGWLRELKKKTGLLLQSRRWKLVNLLGEFAFGPLGRAKTPAQIKKINDIFSDFANTNPKNKKGEIRKLCAKIDSYERNYRLLINSRRWKSSNAVISMINLFLFRKKEELVTTAIEDVLAQFKKWRHENKEKYNI